MFTFKDDSDTKQCHRVKYYFHYNSQLSKAVNMLQLAAVTITLTPAAAGCCGWWVVRGEWLQWVGAVGDG